MLRSLVSVHYMPGLVQLIPRTYSSVKANFLAHIHLTKNQIISRHTNFQVPLTERETTFIAKYRTTSVPEINLLKYTAVLLTVHIVAY